MAFLEHKVVPDVINDVPTNICEAKFAEAVVNLGNEITPEQAAAAPSLTWSADEKTLYTVVMTDPDAPSRANPKFGQWCHWVVFNVPGTDISKGSVQVEYMGPAPPPGTGLHRYIFLIYQQPASLPAYVLTGGSRAKWKVNDLAKTYDLGKPLAGNFFFASNK